VRTSALKNPSVIHQARELATQPQLRLFLSFIAVLLIGSALYFVVRSISLPEVWHIMQASNLRWLAVAIGTTIVIQAFRVMRSVSILSWESRPHPADVAQAIAGGQVINWLSPIRAGDVWRVLYLGRSGKNSLLWIAGSVVMEKGADSVVLALFGFLLLLLPVPAGLSVPVTKLIITAIICLMLFSAISALGSSRLRNRLLARIPRLDQWINAALPESRAHYEPRRWLAMFCASMCIWALGLVLNIAVAHALGLQIDLATHLLLLLTMQTTTVLAPVPGNVGIFPLITHSVLSASGVDPAIAIAYGSLLFVVAYGMLIVLSGLAFVPALIQTLLPRATATATAMQPPQPNTDLKPGIIPVNDADPADASESVSAHTSTARA
jgi:uncharacterized membrane protein YbhN (UPF0104 family)